MKKQGFRRGWRNAVCAIVVPELRVRQLRTDAGSGFDDNSGFDDGGGFDNGGGDLL